MSVKYITVTPLTADGHPVELQKDDQCCRHHQLIGDRIEECAESRGLIQLSRKPAVEPIGDCSERKNNGRDEILIRQRDPAFLEVEDTDEQRNQDDPEPRQQVRYVKRHRFSEARRKCVPPARG